MSDPFDSVVGPGRGYRLQGERAAIPETNLDHVLSDIAGRLLLADSDWQDIAAAAAAHYDIGIAAGWVSNPERVGHPVTPMFALIDEGVPVGLLVPSLHREAPGIQDGPETIASILAYRLVAHLG